MFVFLRSHTYACVPLLEATLPTQFAERLGLHDKGVGSVSGGAGGVGGGGGIGGGGGKGMPAEASRRRDGRGGERKDGAGKGDRGGRVKK